MEMCLALLAMELVFKNMVLFVYLYIWEEQSFWIYYAWRECMYNM